MNVIVIVNKILLSTVHRCVNFKQSNFIIGHSLGLMVKALDYGAGGREFKPHF